MKSQVLNQNELNNLIHKIYQEEYFKIFEEKWESLNKKEKIFLFEVAKSLYPENTKLINESKWYNTAFDIAGIFDPTGLIDLGNGISYWNQGDKLFAILSWISAFPVIGDLIAKPVVGVLKTGGEAAKMFKTASLSGDALKIAKSAEMAGGPIAKLVQSSPSWGKKLVGLLYSSVGKVPLLGRGLVQTVEEYVKLFSTASKEMKVGTEAAMKLASKEASALTKLERDELLKQISKSGSFKGFRDYKAVDPSFFHKWIRGGMPRLFGNRSTRALMRKTKWYLGFLDFLGLGNFVGPEELENVVPNLDQKISEYNQTSDAQKNIEQDFGNNSDQQVTPPPPPSTSLIPSSSSNNSSGGLGDFFKTVLGNAIF
jgi:hypothetical protein